ncbi:MAG: hypothetical protein E3K37_08235 [Candidatus Kuenenia sp.]|nr:hypothetical protein [Candidatus Kuenenia hertensis]
MGKDEFCLSVNTKTIILILLFFNICYGYKKISEYYRIKEAGYLRERTFQEQIQQRMMKSFGSVEEMERLVTEITTQKKEAEKTAATLRIRDKQMTDAYKKLEDAKSILEEEKALLQKKIWEMEDVLSKRKRQYEQTIKANAELMDAKTKLEEEQAQLQTKIKEMEGALSKQMDW